MSNFTILILSRSFGREYKQPLKILEKNGCKTNFLSNMDRPLKEEDLLKLTSDVDGIIVGAEKITKKIINNTKKLRVISKHGVGVDNIDLRAATKKGIIVTNVPDANFNAVADLTFGLMITAARSICEADRTVRNGQWKKYIGVELWEKTLGVIGTGKIGKAVITRSRGFNMKVLAYDLFKDEAFARKHDFSYVPFKSVLENSDFVTIHVPLTEKSRNLIGEKELRIMKKTSYLINAARGEIIDEDALYKALINGWIAGAALDVFKNEPLTDSSLLTLQNITLTPHIGAYSYEAIKKMGEVSVINLLNVLKGKQPLYRVN